MSAAVALPRMSFEEFLAWSEDQEGNFELDDGLVVAMAPDRIVHARAKGATYRALVDAIAKAGLPCEAFVEGPGVRVAVASSYQPDVIVQCGERLPGHERMIPAPLVVVEILSPSTAYRDLGRKLRAYFQVPAIAHYLIVDADERVVTHHRRGQDGTILTTALTEGSLTLDPPDLTVAILDLLPPAET